MRLLNFLLNVEPYKLLKTISSNKRVVLVISEVVLNILLKNIPLKADVVRKLRKYKRVLYKLADPKVTVHQKTNILKRHTKLINILSSLVPLILKSFQYEPLYEDVSD